MMMRCGAKGLVLSVSKCKYTKIRKSIDIGIQLSTSMNFQYATSGSRIENLTNNSDILCHKLNLEMKLPVIHKNELLYSHPIGGNHHCSNSVHIFNQRRCFYSMSKNSIVDNAKSLHFVPSENENDNQHTLLRNRTAAIFRNYRRTFLRPTLDARQIGSIPLLEIKKFLRQKLVDFKETHACLCLR